MRVMIRLHQRQPVNAPDMVTGGQWLEHAPVTTRRIGICVGEVKRWPVAAKVRELHPKLSVAPAPTGLPYQAGSSVTAP
jgi:hypothetical protein